MKALVNINYVDDRTEIEKLDGSDAMSYSGKQRGTKEQFTFDRVFCDKTSQKVIFEELSFLVQSALEGYNVCVFAYGQTGSGKTYTMEGEHDLKTKAIVPGTEGVIPRTVNYIFLAFNQMQEIDNLWEYKIQISFIEICKEQITDLLDSKDERTVKHEIRMVDTKSKQNYVMNLNIIEIRRPEDLHNCLQTAQRNRKVRATLSNDRSSRAHSVIMMKLIGTHKEKKEILMGSINMIDLAGCEKLKNPDINIEETTNINLSLSTLNRVVLAISKKQEHIPYRESKLTHLLMNYLGGANCKMLMLANISQSNEFNETYKILEFATNVNNCKNIKRSKFHKNL